MALPPFLVAAPQFVWRQVRGLFLFISGLGAAVTFLAMLSGPRGARFTSQLSVSGLVLPPDTIIIHYLVSFVKSLFTYFCVK